MELAEVPDLLILPLFVQFIHYQKSYTGSNDTTCYRSHNLFIVREFRVSQLGSQSITFLDRRPAKVGERGLLGWFLTV